MARTFPHLFFDPSVPPLRSDQIIGATQERKKTETCAFSPMKHARQCAHFTVWIYRAQTAIAQQGVESALLLSQRDLEDAPSAVHPNDAGHLSIRQLKIAKAAVLAHALGIRGLREDDVAFLDAPAQDDLYERFAALIRSWIVR